MEADRESLLCLYNMLIKPKMDYGIEVYSSASKTYINSIYAIQHAAIRIATGAFRSSPVTSLHAESGLKPYYYAMQTKFLNFYTRIIINPNNPLNKYLENITSNSPKGFLHRAHNILITYEIDPNNILQELTTDVPPWKPMPLTICTDLYKYKKCNISATELKQKFLNHFQDHSTSLTIFTDGSKSHHGVGYAIVTENETIKHRIPNAATNYTAELLAISNAIDYAENQTQDDIHTENELVPVTLKCLFEQF